MEITIKIDSENEELLAKVMALLNEKPRPKSDAPQHFGTCCTCPHWTSANLGKRGARVKWGNCAVFNNAAINEAHEWCDFYKEELECQTEK